MSPIELLRAQSEIAFFELETALSGVHQELAWAVLPNNGVDYLHTDGSIYGITLHVATAKRMYGNIAFQDGDLKWRECADQLDAFEPDWSASLAYLRESQRLWMASWAELGDDDLAREVLHFRGGLWPAWKIIQTMLHHDVYHAGQIALLRFGCAETDVPPNRAAADIREHCTELPHW